MARIDISRYDTDKGEVYLGRYEDAFAALVDREVDLLELGVHRGGSMHLWRDFFPRGRITGVDLLPVEVADDSGRVRVFQADQTDADRLSEIAREVAPGGFDVIIDDASHFARETAAAFWHLFVHHLKPGGVYVIEDWGAGYFVGWPDGRRFRSAFAPVVRPRRAAALQWVRRVVARVPGAEGLLPAIDDELAALPLPTHRAGTVGFVKQLVDACAIGDIQRHAPEHDLPGGVRIDRMQLSTGQAFLWKAAGT